jgi:hypothetical protein
MIDRGMSFLNKMYFLNEEQPERKRVRTISNILHAILDQTEAPAQRSGDTSCKRGLELDVSAPELDSDAEDSASNPEASAKVMERILSSAHLRDVNRLRRVAQLESLGPDGAAASAPASNGEKASRSEINRIEVERMRFAANVESLRHEIEALRSSRSWRITAPLRSLGRWARRYPSVVRWVRRLRA